MYSLSEGTIFYKGKPWIPTPNLKKEIIEANYDHPLAGHSGVEKILELVRQYFNWPGMHKMITGHIKNCVTCACTKPSKHKPHGLLHPLPIAAGPWRSMSVDFITIIPPSEGFDSIMVVVDRFTKMAKFLPCTKEFSASNEAALFLKEIWSRHGFLRKLYLTKVLNLSPSSGNTYCKAYRLNCVFNWDSTPNMMVKQRE